MRKPAHNPDAGFTLIEIIITIVVLALFATVLATYFGNSMDAVEVKGADTDMFRIKRTV